MTRRRNVNGGGYVDVDMPSEPEDLTATNVTKTSCTLCWNAPQNDGGSSVTRYYVEMYNEQSGWIRINETPAAECWTDIDGLLDGAENEFRVCAVNEGGVGPPSESTFVIWTPGELNKPNCAPSSTSELSVMSAVFIIRELKAFKESMIVYLSMVMY